MYGDRSRSDVQEKCNSNVEAEIRYTVSTDSVNTVISRVFYNSMVKKQNVQALLARGNKTKHLTATNTLWKGVGMGTVHRPVTTLSTPGKGDSPLSNIEVYPKKCQNVKNIAQQSQMDTILKGVRTIELVIRLNPTQRRVGHCFHHFILVPVERQV